MVEPTWNHGEQGEEDIIGRGHPNYTDLATGILI